MRRQLVLGWLLLVAVLVVLYVVGQWTSSPSISDAAVWTLLHLVLPVGGFLAVTGALGLLKVYLEKHQDAQIQESQDPMLCHDEPMPSVREGPAVPDISLGATIALWLFKLFLVGLAYFILGFVYVFWQDENPPTSLAVLGVVIALYLSVKANAGWLLAILVASSVLFVHGCVSNFKWLGG